MQTQRVVLWAAGLVLASACMAGQAQDLKRLSAVADSVARDHQFSGTLLVAKGDKVLLERAYGEANVEWHIPNRPDTRFRLGSVTKQFTAAAILLLQEQGKLRVSDRLDQHLSALPESWRAVTVEQLLTHTSGIHSFTDIAGYPVNERMSSAPAQVLEPVRNLPLDFAPGSRFNYSNSGYVLLGMLIEQVSGMRYAQFLQQYIFDPLGMKDSGYDSNTAIIARRAAGYTHNGGKLENAGFIDMSVPHAAGALYSTTSDLLRWQRALYEGKLLKPESLRAMTTPKFDEYAFGLGVLDGPQGKQYGHGGGIEGFSTLVGYRPAERISVILLSNVETHYLPELERPLFTVARGQPVVLPSERKQIALSPAERQQLAGTYVAPDGRRLRLRVEGSGLQARLGGRPWMPVLAERPDYLFARLVDEQYQVERAADGAVLALTLQRQGRATRLQRRDEQLADYAAAPFYLRGEMNDWGVRDRMVQLDAHTYATTVALEKKRYAFKFGSEDFRAIDFGGAEGKELARLDIVQPLEPVGENLQMDVTEAGTYRFTLEVSDPRMPRLTVTRVP